jgi:hypothetical protein
VTRKLLLLAVLSAAVPALASFPGKRLFIPVAGKIGAAGGVQYATDLWITNVSDRDADVRIALLDSGQANEPRFVAVKIPKRATKQFDNVTETLLHRPGIIGALLIRSDEEIVASARTAIFDAAAGDERGSALNAIPIELAAGKGERIVLHGAGAAGGRFRYNIHLVETNRAGVVVVLSVYDERGWVKGTKQILLRELEASTIPLSDFAPTVPARGIVQIEVIQGSGRVIAAGSMTAANGDPTVFEMSFPHRVRSDIPARELVAWAAAALALIVSALWSRRRHA